MINDQEWRASNTKSWVLVTLANEHIHCLVLHWTGKNYLRSLCQKLMALQYHRPFYEMT